MNESMNERVNELTRQGVHEITHKRVDVLTSEAIRALDGPALTRLAYSLGLAPAEVFYDAVHGIFRYTDGPMSAEDGAGPVCWLHSWAPHMNIPQAREVCFDQMYQGGWYIEYHKNGRGQMSPSDGVITGYKGACKIKVFWREEPRFRRTWQAPTEAHALLLCAVLAAASEQETTR